jgi:hypothetical protein
MRSVATAQAGLSAQALGSIFPAEPALFRERSPDAPPPSCWLDPNHAV